MGFKFTHRQNEVIYRRLLEDRAVRKIVLERRNRMKTYVSRLIAEQLEEWEVYREEDLTRERVPVEVDPARFLESVAWNDAYYAEVKQALTTGEHVWIETAFEDLPRLEEQNALLDLLAVERTTTGLRTRSIKQNSRELAVLVSNHAELIRFFGGTEYEAELRSVHD